MRLHVPAARRSGVALIMAGFIAGIVLTMTVLSVLKDEHVLRQLGHDDAHHHHHHHRGGGSDGHGHGGSDEDLKVVDLSEQDKHKHAGQRPLPLVWSSITSSDSNSHVLASSSVVELLNYSSCTLA